MKGFALLTAAVLAVIGIGVGLVGGLSVPTYSLGSARFSIVISANLHRQPIGSFPCVVADATTADQGRLSVNIWVLEQSGRCAANPPRWYRSNGPGNADVGFKMSTSANSDILYLMGMSGVQLCPPQGSDGCWMPSRVPPGASCWGTVGVQGADYYIALAVQSSEGSAVAESVLNSFTILGSGASS